jgi:hypothetical protein
MSTAVFLIGYLCLGLPGDVECKNIASKFLYVGMQDCMIAKEEIYTELKDLTGLQLQCISSDLIENYVEYRPEILNPATTIKK